MRFITIVMCRSVCKFRRGNAVRFSSQQTIPRLRSFLDFVGIGIFLFFLFVQWETFQANQRVHAVSNMIVFWIEIGPPDESPSRLGLRTCLRSLSRYGKSTAETQFAALLSRNFYAALRIRCARLVLYCQMG